MNLSAINRSAFFTIMINGLIRVLRMWRMVLLPPVLTATLYFVVFGRIIGGRIGDMHGYSYVSYILPGLVMLSVIVSAYTQGSNSLFLERFQHSFDDLLASPVCNMAILAGYVGVAVLRSMIVGLLVLGVSLFFTNVHVAHYAATLGMMVLASMVFGAAGLLNGMFAKSFDDISVVPTFVLMPLIYLGGVFYPLDALPGFWRDISFINPIAYIISGMRYSMLGLESSGWLPSLLVMLVLLVGLFSLMNYMLSHSARIRA